MPTTTVKEFPNSRRVTVSLKNPSAEFGGWANGSDDEGDILQAVINYLPPVYANLQLYIDSIDVDQQGPEFWHWTARYGLAEAGVKSDGSPIDGQGDDAQPPQPPEQAQNQQDNTPLGPEYSWETAGGTKRLMKSYDVVSSHIDPAIGGTPPDIKGAIGLSKDGVEGVDVPANQFSWSVTYEFAFVTRKYLRTLRNLTNTVNAYEWQGRDVRGIRFDGSSGRIGKDGKAEVTFRFTEMDRQTFVAVGAMVIPEIKGFDHLDIGFGGAVSESFKIEVPQRAYVHKIYLEADFTELGIG